MDRRLQAEATISDHVIYALGGAAIPLPLFDIAAVTAVQLNLVRDLAAIHEVDHDVTSGRTLITSLAGASLPRLGASMIKLVPGLGWLAGALTQVALSGATTYAVGNVFDRLFESRRELGSVDVEEIRGLYDELVEEGGGFVHRLRHREPDERIQLRGLARALLRLERLRDSGRISSSEFERLKAVALASI